MNSGLPSGWCRAKLGSIISLDYGKGLVKKVRDHNGKFTVFGSNGPVGKHSSFLVKKPCLIVGRKGAIGEIHLSRNPSWPIDTTYFVTSPNGISLDFLFHILSFLKLSKLDKSTAIPGLNRNDVYNIEIDLPPTNEQHRIVAKIEELFTRLDAGVEALKQAQAQLKRYRQSVLKAAVEGRLTAKWREGHLPASLSSAQTGKDELEPANKLLERIIKERREKWEAEQLAKYEAQGKTQSKNWRDKYEEPTLPDMTEFLELPEGWKWASIDQISYEIRYGSSSKTNMDTNGIPVLRMGNIVDGNLIFDKLKYLPENHNEFPDLLLDSGDLLFNRTNSVELVGKTAVYNGYPSPCSYASYLIRVRFSRGVEPNFISYFINSVYGRAWIRSVVSQQVGQANVNGTKLKNLAVPLPPFDEQKNIVSELERLFSIIYESESRIHREINRVQSLRQSILKRAFEGKLVPQDAKDPPASVLLEKIKAEKAKPKKSKQLEMF